ncbi:hypothetical protein GQ53DRAFT_48247 [Thozetella sp. PMI_491]|nr:hypothetical protein GQ53DRAFT_48247 [Thozetella sp. PMI_491]
MPPLRARVYYPPPCRDRDPRCTSLSLHVLPSMSAVFGRAVPTAGAARLPLGRPNFKDLTRSAPGSLAVCSRLASACTRHAGEQTEPAGGWPRQDPRGGAGVEGGFVGRLSRFNFAHKQPGKPGPNFGLLVRPVPFAACSEFQKSAPGWTLVVEMACSRTQGRL